MAAAVDMYGRGVQSDDEILEHDISDAELSLGNKETFVLEVRGFRIKVYVHYGLISLIQGYWVFVTTLGS